MNDPNLSSLGNLLEPSSNWFKPLSYHVTLILKSKPKKLFQKVPEIQKKSWIVPWCLEFNKFIPWIPKRSLFCETLPGIGNLFERGCNFIILFSILKSTGTSSHIPCSKSVFYTPMYCIISSIPDIKQILWKLKLNKFFIIYGIIGDRLHLNSIDSDKVIIAQSLNHLLTILHYTLHLLGRFT